MNRNTYIFYPQNVPMEQRNIYLVSTAVMLMVFNKQEDMQKIIDFYPGGDSKAGTGSLNFV